MYCGLFGQNCWLDNFISGKWVGFTTCLRKTFIPEIFLRLLLNQPTDIHVALWCLSRWSFVRNPLLSLNIQIIYKTLTDWIWMLVKWKSLWTFWLFWWQFLPLPTNPGHTIFFFVQTHMQEKVHLIFPETKTAEHSLFFKLQYQSVKSEEELLSLRYKIENEELLHHLCSDWSNGFSCLFPPFFHRFPRWSPLYTPYTTHLFLNPLYI